jgi:proteasome lid subunit RPN8/RPN11
MSKETPLVLPRKLVDSILELAKQNAGTEICGLIGSLGGKAASWYPIDNIAADPVHRFEMNPKQQIDAMRQMRENGERLHAIVHSHPHGPAVPSVTDIEEIGYPDAISLIVSAGTEEEAILRGFRLCDGSASEIELVCPAGDQTMTG